MKLLLRKNLNIAIFGIVLSLYSNISSANGYISPVGGPHRFYISMESDELINEVGYSVKKNFDMGGRYSGTIDCPTTMQLQSTYYKAESSLPASSYGNGYLKLNDFLDIKVEVWIDGYTQKYVTVPFHNVDNKFPDTCYAPSTTLTKYASGSKGTVTFRVSKKIINGVEIRDQQIIDMYGRLGTMSNGFGSEPMSQVFIQSAILLVPDKCVVNEGQLISIEFGEVGSTNLNGNNFPRSVPVRFECKGGVFEDGALNISLAVSGATAPFSDNVLKTNRNNLGIQLKGDRGIILPNKFYPIPMKNGGGIWNLIATPLSKDNTEVEEGDFNASGTIVAAFQ
ncbi:MAG: fimbrial protein [Chania sp.]